VFGGFVDRGLRRLQLGGGGFMIFSRCGRVDVFDDILDPGLNRAIAQAPDFILPGAFDSRFVICQDGSP
jgi:hypothetical protein